MFGFRNLISIGIIVVIAVLIATWLAKESRAQAPEKTSLAGVWTINTELSDQPPAHDERGDQADDRPGRRGYGGGAGGRGGGYGRGGFGGGRQGRGGGDRQEMVRMRDAMRDILNPPDHLTITQTDSMVIVTAPDGRTLRLSPDGSKIKDENTNVERKTRWDAGSLVSEISGLGPGKMTQTFSVDAAHHLHVAVQTEAARGRQARSITRVYDAAAQ